MLNRMERELPAAAVAMHVAVAGLAAVGMTSLLPVAIEGDQTLLLVPLLALLVALALLVRTRETVDRAREEAGRAWVTDSLTGLSTAQVADNVLGLEFAAAQRGRPLTVALFRLERMDAYRSAHGRAAENQLLRLSGRTFRRHRRSMHVAARYGDDDTFLSVLSGVDLKGAATYASKVRKQLLAPPSVPGPAGVSVGIATFDLSMHAPEDLVGQAQLALRKAGTEGGKIVVVGQMARR